MRILLAIFTIISFACQAQVNVTAKSTRIYNSDSTHSELDGTEYRNSAGKFRYKQNGVWYYRASTADIAANATLAGSGLTKSVNTIRLGGNLTTNTTIGDNGGGQFLSFGLTGTRLGRIDGYATSVNFDGTTSANFQVGSQALTLSTTVAALNGATTNMSGTSAVNLSSSAGSIMGTANGDVNFTSSTGQVNLISTISNVNLVSGNNVDIISSGVINLTTNSVSRLQIDNDGSWTINSTPGTAGQVLTSAGASSTPTWATSATTETASNGLTKVVNDIRLGGTLTGNTTILGGGFNLTIEPTNLNLNATTAITSSSASFSLQTIGGDLTLNVGDDIILPGALTNNNALTSLMGRNSVSGEIEERTVASLTGTPAGSTTQIQFNNAGAFGADADLTFTGGNLLTATNTTVTTALINSALTATRIPVIGASGLFSDDADLSFTGGNTLHTQIISSSSAVGGGGGLVVTTESHTSTPGSVQIIPGTATSGNTVGGRVLLASGAGSGSGINGNVEIDLIAGRGGAVNGYFLILGIPTSSVGLPSGAVYSNAGVLTIIP